MIYFIQEKNDGEFVKIGVTSRGVAERLCSMQTGNPRELEIVATLKGMYQMERAIHRKFAAHRHRGEWFYFHQDIKDFIANPIIDEIYKPRAIPRPVLERHYEPLTPIPCFNKFSREITESDISLILTMKDNDVPTLVISRQMSLGIEEVSEIIRQAV